MMSIEDLLTRRRDVDEDEYTRHAADLDTKGYAHVHDYLDPALIAAMLGLVEDQIAALRQDNTMPEEWAADWVYNLQNKDKRFIEFLEDPFVERLMIAKLNEPYYRYIPPDQPNYILGQYLARSSTQALALHIDAGMPHAGNDTSMIQVAYLLEDSTLENGCTVIIPGSQTSGGYADRARTDTQSLPASAGDVLIWDARVWHGAHANTTGKSRWAIIATYQRWWVKQSFDIPRALPVETYAQLTAKQKALLGYCTIPPVDEHDRITRALPPDELRPAPCDFYNVPSR